ncbi:MAG TPA: hypothetical protein VG734_20485 [Lacunisphaera sp.]|nr:hypothetical protein [Lacunisphaera sp.]
MSVTFTPSPGRTEARVAALLFAGLLVFHAWAATVGWKSLSLPGVEFRQAQTALSSHFIQRERNFSLAYPTPVLGKPWSIPMEFPLYQWTVVRLSDLTGQSLTEAGRTVSLGCFYLTLPAFYLLLGRVGLVPVRRLIALGLVITCPLYIFYARAFLMETMALMFGTWFLVGHVETVDGRRADGLALAVLGGVGAGLVKVTTLLLFLGLALVWTLARLRRAVASGERSECPALAAWSMATVVVPCLAAVWWVHQADAIKELNVLGRFLTSAALHDYNWGSGQRFAAALWRDHAAIIFREIISLPIVAGAFALWAVFSRRNWQLVGGCVAAFLAVQLAFPILYALHPYYYVANAFLLLVAVGVALGGLLESRLPRSLAWGFLLVCGCGQLASYWRMHYPVQRTWSNGGTTLTLALHEVTEPDSVLLIAGDDWSSIIPYYAQRRACMFPSGREQDAALRARVFAGLAGERISALVLRGPQRANGDLVATAVATFGIDPRPVFSREDITVYLRKENRDFAIQRIAEMRLAGVELTAESAVDQGTLTKREVLVTSLPPLLRGAFDRMSPRPVRYYSTFGAGVVETPFGVMYNAHPETRLWFELPRGARSVRVECFFSPDAYQPTLAANEHTDGVSISIQVQVPGGARRVIAERLLDPAAHEADRGLVTLAFKEEMAAGSTAIIEILPGPHGSYTRDWFSLGQIEFK